VVEPGLDGGNGVWVVGDAMEWDGTGERTSTVTEALVVCRTSGTGGWVFEAGPDSAFGGLATRDGIGNDIEDMVQEGEGRLKSRHGQPRSTSCCKMPGG
jgi:hypothetical protein